MPDIGIPTPELATPGTRGLVEFTSPDELLKRDEEEAKKLSEQEQSQPIVLSLASHMRTVWQKHRDAKQQHIEPILLNCLRLRQGKYDAATLAQITAQGGTDLFIKLTKATCRAAKAWMADIYTEKPFALTPTPVPDLPEEVEQQVIEKISSEYEAAILAHYQVGIEFDESDFKEQAEKYKVDTLQAVKDQAQIDDEALENEINDDLTEGGWYEALDDVIWDIVTFPAAFLKGPITRMTKTLQWAEGQPVVEEVPKKSWERVSPFDIYPSPTAKTIQDGDFIERHRLSRQALQNLIGVDGYSETAIRTVLSEYSTGGLKLWLTNDQERQMLENKPLDTGTSDLIDALQFFGSVQGSLLLEWGMEAEEIPEPTDEYQIEGWLIGNTIISAVINPDPLGRRNYFSASYDENPDSIWGEGVPLLMEDVQYICNSMGRAIVNNAGIASGPQVAVLADLLQPGMDVTTMFPWKIWQFKAEQFTNGQVPIQFFQPDPILDVLIKVYDYFFKQASEVTGIPAYIAGSDKLGGAAKTASGLSMLMNAANKGLKAVVTNVDKGIIKPSVKAHWQNLMLYEPEKAQGDINIVARASEYLIMMESLQARRMEFLNFTNNDVDNQIMGPAGRAEVLRETAKTLKLPVDRIIPDKKSILNNVHQAEMQELMMNLSEALGIPVDQLMQAASGRGSGGQAAQPKARTLDMAGHPMGRA